jgi:hypothetical protein
MSDKILYYNIDTGKLINSNGSQLSAKPTISYQAEPTWEIRFVTVDIENAEVIPVNLSKGVAWKAAVDTDFDVNTVPMMRTLDDGIDNSNGDQGVILVSLDANTQTFLEKVNKSSGVTATFELRGSDSDGRIIYDFRFQVSCVGAIDPNGTDPIPVPDASVTREWVLGNLRKAPEYQFSINGIDWHSERNHEDLYYQTRYPEGEWSETIELINGVDGFAPTIEIGEVKTIDPSGVVSVTNVGTPDAAIWNFEIPRGEDGRDGWIVAVGETKTGDPGTNAIVEYGESYVEGIGVLTLNFTIPRGEKGEDGQDGTGGMTDAERSRLLPTATISGQIPMWDGDEWVSQVINFNQGGGGNTDVPDNVLTEDDLGVIIPNLSGGYLLSSQLPTIPSSKLPTIPSGKLQQIPSSLIYGSLPISMIYDLQNQLNLRMLQSNGYTKEQIDTKFAAVDTSTFVSRVLFEEEMASNATALSNMSRDLDSKLSRTVVWDNGSINGDLVVDGKRGDYQIIALAEDGVISMAQTSFTNFDRGDSVMLEVNKTVGSVLIYDGKIILNLTDSGTFLFGIFNNGSRIIITAPTEAL